MLESVSERLAKSTGKIITIWEERVKTEISSAARLTKPALAKVVGIYLKHLVEALSANRKMDVKSMMLFDLEATRIAELHGSDRAGRADYILSEVMQELQILREIIFQELEEEEQLHRNERDIILDSIESTIASAAAYFSNIHEDIRQKFVSALTHDLRNPITAAKANAQLILRKVEKRDVCINSASRIIASLNRLDAMIRDLLDASRIRAGEPLSLQFIECDLDSLIRDIVDELALIYGDRFSVRSEKEILGIFSDDGLRRAIENLLINAVKYSLPQSQITISLEKSKNIVRIKIHNEGPAIPDNEKELLFQQHRRSKTVEKSAQTGWGLGLSFVKGVMDAHHGTVRVESSTEKGTDFILEIPFNRNGGNESIAL